jgi:hypothetical protein
MSSQECIAYISRGKLYLSENASAFRLIESTFVSQLKSRLQSIQKKQEWKTSGAGAMFMGVWRDSSGSDSINLDERFTGFTDCEENNNFIYSIQTNSMGGLFRYDTTDHSELRLMHREHFHISDLNYNSQTGMMACSLSSSNGIANIGVMALKKNFINEVTEGDSFDEAPHWIPGAENELVFHSAGIGRNSEGHFVGRGNFSIIRLNVATGNIETILESPKYDYLAPQYNEKGELFCIRRNYDSAWMKGATLSSVMKDTVLFPIRLGRAVVHYLNFFSMLYTKKPLITAGGIDKKGPDPRSMFLYGRMVDIEKEMKKAGKANPEGNIIPSDWEFLKIGLDGKETILDRRVASFDISGKDVVYTNGTKIFRLKDGSVRDIIGEGQFIEQVKYFCRQ